MISTVGRHRPDTANTIRPWKPHEEAQSISYYSHAVSVDERSQTADNLFSHHSRHTVMASSQFLTTKAFTASANRLGTKIATTAPSHKC